MVFQDARYPALSRFFARAAASRRRRGIRTRIPLRPQKRQRLNTFRSTAVIPRKLYSSVTPSRMKSYVQTNNIQTTNILGSVCLNAIDRRTTANQSLDTRENDFVNLVGFKLNMNFQNLLNNTCVLNVAIVSTRISAASLGSELFSSGAGTARASHWSNTSLTPYEKFSLPINSDDYKVHFHNRYQLATNGTAQPMADFWPYIVNIRKYIPLNMQIKYNGTSGTPDVGVYLIHWMGITTEAANQTATANAYQVTMNNITYFRDE